MISRAPSPTAASQPQAGEPGDDVGRLDVILAKSPRSRRPGERLTAHSLATLRAAGEIRDRLGAAPPVVAEAADLGDRFWILVAWAALLHDAGKIADGFQRMLADGTPWGHRHEVLSLGFLPRLLEDPAERGWVGLAVATHHRALISSGDGGAPSLRQLYGDGTVEWLRSELGPSDPAACAELSTWFGRQGAAAGLLPSTDRDDPRPDAAPATRSKDIADRPKDADVVDDAHRLLAEILNTWGRSVRSDRGLAAVLLQGAVTLADHLSSAHGALHTTQPFDGDYPARLTARLATQGHRTRSHQAAAGAVDGHLILRAWTGSGKTEGGLLWAAGQVEAIRRQSGGVPRLFYSLPYLASINAMANRLAAQELADHGGISAVGVSHSRAASYYLSRSLCGDEPEAGPDDRAPATAADKAVARAHATRLFRETVRVGTPYQQLRGVLAGPAHSSVLLDCANSVFVLDELHAYDPQRLGYILATAGLWARLGSRIGVLSATTPSRLVGLIRETLTEIGTSGGDSTVAATVTVIDADSGTAPVRHRVRTAGQPLTDPATIAAIRRRLAAAESVLVVANNIADAQHLYAELAPHVAPGPDGSPPAHLLHSRFTRRDRTRIEQALTSRYRNGLRPADRQPGLVVATQVVEVSLDVDFDVLVTSAAPLDALIQRFGRVNRTGVRPPADVIICPAEPRTRRGNSTDLFADGVYDYSPTEATWSVLTRHDGQDVSEADLARWLDGLYDSDWGHTWEADVRRHQQKWKTTFLRFSAPFTDRSGLADEFDRMFDGVEGVLAADTDEYSRLLTAGNGPSAGRLLAADLLIPLPHYARGLGRWDRDLDVLVIDGDYSPATGLTDIRPTKRTSVTYELGELI
ncbi:CRISPR-associated helicase/endonuclease Cas3 [Parafrankia sp. EUN1f]|uniref:CRISPR-associated helicase/endonuclease Cas3 n=1 Tax=Parafrankia sp. EUN1f TaxID=102897 RepID=UPI0001C46401|nr:CRISPR-associated helicase/endonuclease Cas3 [Parafrankia sp. EUN1f]EFC81107.1 metal dependent phosphohydrolase [Parafrankia sp. EUN1f]